MNQHWQILETFVLVARLGSMKAAAERLSVTAGAISQRMQALQQRMGSRLYERRGNGIVLTAVGDKLFRDLEEPMARIEEIWRTTDPQQHSAGARKRLVISTMPSFANHVLVPRLGAFSAQHPEIDVTIETELRVVDLKSEPVDIAIRHGLGDYPGLKSTWLLAPPLIVVASRELLARHPAVKQPADCLKLPLLHDRARQDWRLWLAAHGVTAPEQLPGPAFSDDSLLASAAVAGQGLALVRDFYAAEALRRGRLKQVLDVAWPARFAYYAVATPEALRRAHVRSFRDWLVEELAGGEKPLRTRENVRPVIASRRREA